MTPRPSPATPTWAQRASSRHWRGWLPSPSSLPIPMGSLRDTSCWIRRAPMCEESSPRVARRPGSPGGTLRTSWVGSRMNGRMRRDREAASLGATHLGNIRSALDWCSSRADETEFHVRLASLASELLLDLNLLTECRRICERALSALGASEAGTRHEMVLHGSLGRALLLTDNSGGETDAHFRRALAIAEPWARVSIGSGPSTTCTSTTAAQRCSIASSRWPSRRCRSLTASPTR